MKKALAGLTLLGIAIGYEPGIIYLLLLLVMLGLATCGVVAAISGE